MARVDYRSAEMLQKIAALPYYGQAIAVLRRVDPFWKFETGELREFLVVGYRYEEAECPTCGCDCGGYEAQKSKDFLIEAVTAEEAIEIAEIQHKGYSEFEVKPPRYPADLPKEFWQ